MILFQEQRSGIISLRVQTIGYTNMAIGNYREMLPNVNVEVRAIRTDYSPINNSTYIKLYLEIENTDPNDRFAKKVSEFIKNDGNFHGSLINCLIRAILKAQS
jgi:hypothetical protein